MNRSETFFIGGVPVGKIVQNEFDGTLAFLPREGFSKPPAKAWSNVDELKDVLRKLYGRPNP